MNSRTYSVILIRSGKFTVDGKPSYIQCMETATSKEQAERQALSGMSTEWSVTSCLVP
jgi:hypothetical protein